MNTVEKAKLALLSMQRYSWEQGVAMQAFLEQGDTETVIAMAKEAAYRRSKDGRTAVMGNNDAVTDPCSTGEALIFAFRETQDKAIGEACESLLCWALEKAPRNSKGIVYHLIHKPQFWVDSMYMLPPYLAAAGHPEEALHQIRGYWDALYHPEEQLMSHMWDDARQEFIRKDFWGVGNGWAMAGLARVIDLLPTKMAGEKEELAQMARTLLSSVLGYAREDGLFHNVINDTSTFVETNLSQMAAYTIYRGIRSGWFPVSQKAEAERLRKAVYDKVDRFGLVQGVCGAPEFNSPGVAPEGQGFFLLMESVSGH
jgi:Predicted unsaturated glucuronyl hydrolase involved in regulation of bacterial surface properties, and related proteins